MWTETKLCNFTTPAIATSQTPKTNGTICTADSECSSGSCQQKTTALPTKYCTDSNTGLTATYNTLNTVTFGAFGNYVQTNQDIAAQNPQASYLKKAFNIQNVAASAKLGTVLTAKGAIIVAAAPVITPVITQAAAAFGSAATLAYINATNAIAQSPTLQTTAALATLSQGPIAIAACEIYGSNSLQCQYAGMGITSSYFSDVIGTEQTLQGSVQVINQNVVQPAVTRVSNYINTSTDPIGDTSNFRLTNAPNMQGPSLSTSVENSNTIFSGDTTLNPLVSAATGEKYTDINDPEFIAAMINDNAIIRQKYNLPSNALQINNPEEYIYTLTKQSEQLGVPVTDVRNLEAFLRDNPNAGGLHTSGGEAFGSQPFIAINPSKDVIQQANVLTHEFIHASQTQYASMPIEIVEYEAYVGSMRNPLNLLEGKLRNYFFGISISGSSYYFNSVNGIAAPWMNLIP